MQSIRSPFLVLAILAVLGSVGFAQESRSRVKNTAPETGTVDFENDLIPVFTRYGCNAGACHGAAIGRGGFKLSLFGGNPRADFDAIVRQVEGSRINLARPEQSLIILKPTESITHGGGERFGLDHDSTKLLLKWIRQGAGLVTQRTLKRVEISPKKHVGNSLGQPVALRATAHFSDGSSRDVTRWTVFQPEDSSAVKIDPESARSRVLRRGRHIVVARYLTEVVPIEFIVPLTDSRVDLAAEPRRGFIDEEVLDSLTTLGLPVSPIADDTTYLRRLTLDLTGRLPTVARVRAFRADANPKKQKALVEELLGSEAFTEYWTLQLATLLRIRPQGRDEVGEGDSQGAATYHEWLADQIRRGVGYDQLARSVIRASGDSHEYGPANFYRTNGDPRKQAEFMSELFMGSRLRCANCHNHPLDRWTQDDYHGLAAIFARIETGRVIEINPSGRVIHPRTLETAVPRIPGEQFLPKTVVDGRDELATWLTRPGNPFFARAIVNRLWKRMMGRGLVEPTDDFRATNPATHPVLLDKLARDFTVNGYKLRHTLKLIAGSASYARSANATPGNRTDDRFYSRAIRQQLEPEVLADAISDVLGVAARYGDEPAGTRAVALVNPKTASLSLDILGRCGRDESCESSPAPGGLPQKLHLFNGPLINARIGVPGSRLSKLISAGKSPMEIVNRYYLVALSRHPNDRETQHWKKQLDAITTADGKREFLEDFVWGLLTCREFVTNH
uniref:Cytochrome c domain-containing protein n=1 Tax=uncultured Planctomycetales bacterium HF0500_40D21 TaxID=710747 RepID=E0XYK0_9BACT|nr:hypothetical protein [uncultured Planctomycetales bacterium HF0500_40D21]ADI22998.1 hypothetical protein [uncultured Planctomycetales bacterium HF0500_40D21]